MQYKVEINMLLFSLADRAKPFQPSF